MTAARPAIRQWPACPRGRLAAVGDSERLAAIEPTGTNCPRASRWRRAAARLVLGALGIITALLHPTASRAAADYPSRPITLLIGSAPAGSTDVIGRVLARSLETELGQPVVVQNTPGAGGSVMATQLKNAVPDGYVLGMAISQAYSGNPLVTPATQYRVDDFTHLAAISKGQCALVTQATSPYRTLEDVIAAARRGERPVFASQSPLTRLVADYIAELAGVEFRIITVQGGGEIMQTILGGHADFGFSGGPHIDYVAAGQMRVLAAVEESRLPTSPDVPTLTELGYDVAACASFVVSAPPGLPPDIEQTLSTALEHAVRSSQVRSLLRELKLPEYYLGPDDVTHALEAEAASIGRAIARIDRAETSGGNAVLTPAFMPYVAAILTGAAMLLLLLTRLAGSGRTEAAAFGPGSWLYLGVAIAVLAIAYALMDTIGYLPGAAATVAGFLVLARARPVVTVAAAIALPTVLWLLFDRLLGFPLP